MPTSLSALGHKYHRHFSKTEADRYAEPIYEAATFSEAHFLWGIVGGAVAGISWTLLVQYVAGFIG